VIKKQQHMQSVLAALFLVFVAVLVLAGVWVLFGNLNSTVVIFVGLVLVISVAVVWASRAKLKKPKGSRRG